MRITDFPPLTLGEVLRPLGSDDDLLEEMLAPAHGLTVIPAALTRSIALGASAPGDRSSA